MFSFMANLLFPFSSFFLHPHRTSVQNRETSLSFFLFFCMRNTITRKHFLSSVSTPSFIVILPSSCLFFNSQRQKKAFLLSKKVTIPKRRKRVPTLQKRRIYLSIIDLSFTSPARFLQLLHTSFHPPFYFLKNLRRKRIYFSNPT